LIILWLLTSGGAADAALPLGFTIAQDLPNLVNNATLIVEGEVVAIKIGRSAGEGTASLQFDDVYIKINNLIKGEEKKEIIIEQVHISEDTLSSAGPAYLKNERYILFLRPGEPGRYVTIPQGRYLLEDGKVIPTQPGPVADRMQGRNAKKFTAEITAIVHGNAGNR